MVATPRGVGEKVELVYGVGCHVRPDAGGRVGAKGTPQERGLTEQEPHASARGHSSRFNGHKQSCTSGEGEGGGRG